MKQNEIDMITRLVMDQGKPTEFKVAGPPVQQQKPQKTSSTLNRHQRRSRNKRNG